MRKRQGLKSVLDFCDPQAFVNNSNESLMEVAITCNSRVKPVSLMVR